MAGRLNDGDERRHASRVPPEHTPWRRQALMRPGHEVHLVNLSAGGALVESTARLRPGLRTELHLCGTGRRTIVGRIDRCRVTALDPIRYQGAMVFDHILQW